MRGAGFIGLLVSMAALGAACSFVTSFPDIEVVGGAGEGGEAPCVAAECQNCLTPASTCPVPGATVALVAPVSGPGEFPATSVEVIEIVQKSDGPRYIGNYLDSQTLGLETPAGVLRAGDQKVGFILGPNGELVAGLGAANGDGTPSGTEALMTSATVADEKLVVAGVFIGPRLVVCPSTIGTNITGEVAAPPGAAASDFVPFVMWFTANGDLVAFSMSPTEPGGDLENGYVSDVAALPGGGVSGRVAAIGYATRDPFNGGAEFGGTPRYYVAVSSGSSASKEATLNKSACGNFSDLDALRSSIAVDASGQIWAAGTGCELGQQGPDESFITRFDGADLVGATTLTLNLPGSQMGITEIAVSTEMVVVAGTYSGTPVEELGNGQPVPVGQPGDAFVMAFTREGWGNQSKPLWFRRIATTGVFGSVDTLATDGSHVFIGGRMGRTGGIGDREGCWESTAPGRGRAFFAQLAEADGALDWLNVEGFEAAGTTDISDFSARGTALSPVDGGLLTATGFHGELLLECGPDATNSTGNPEVWLRLFDLQ